MTGYVVDPAYEIPYLQLVLAFSILVYFVHTYLDVRQVRHTLMPDQGTNMVRRANLVHFTDGGPFKSRILHCLVLRAAVESHLIAVSTITAERLLHPGRIQKDTGLPGGQMVGAARTSCNLAAAMTSHMPYAY